MLKLNKSIIIFNNNIVNKLLDSIRFSFKKVVFTFSKQLELI